MKAHSLDNSARCRVAAASLCLFLTSVVMMAAHAVDSNVMRTITRVKWDDPLNPRHVNLGNDQFLFGTRLGVKLWSLATNEFEDVPFAPGVSHDSLISLDRSWVRLGDAQGTAFLASGADGSHLMLWNAQQHQIAADLKLDSALGRPTRLLRLDAQNVLVCYFELATTLVAQVTHSEKGLILALPKAGDSKVRRVMERTNVVGPIIGFGKLTAINRAHPVFYNSSRCAWEFVDPPEPFKSLIQKYASKVELKLYPIFFGDGRVLITMAYYYNGQGVAKLRRPLLWQPNTRRWTEIERVRRDGTESQSIGQPEPVMSHSFQSDVIEFLDVASMTWHRSVETLPEAYGADIEPLSSGNALVMLRESDASAAGIVGQVAPVRGLLPTGQLLQRRSRYDLELSVRGNLMLFGDGDDWDPNSLIEVIDSNKQQAYKLASWPSPQLSPAIVALKDGSILLFGGLPPGCSRSSNCAPHSDQISMRYFPTKNRWQVLKNLRMPFTHGMWWNRRLDWGRSDTVVRENGDLVWIEGVEPGPPPDDEASLPRISVLKRWNPSHSAQVGQPVAPLGKARTQSTLVELADGRLAVMGGFSQQERVALEKSCIDCPDEFVSIGEFRAAATTEVLDETSAKPTWRAGPLANYSGGRALKLSNGRVFKLSMSDDFYLDSCRAEIADAALTRWQTLPPFPLTDTDTDTEINNVTTVGTRIFILTNKDTTVMWDDTLGKWSVLKGWPAHRADDMVISITATRNDHQVLVRYLDSFAIESVPDRW